jgi:RNA polymerase sigma-70 factor (ECF subfamily)
MKSSSIHQSSHAAENTPPSCLAVDWHTACILHTQPGGKDNMQKTESNIRSEQHLDVCILEKETQEMKEVLTRSMPSFYKRAYRYLDSAADAEDAVQDALLSACQHLDQFKGQSKMSTWLTTIVINSALTKLRRRPRQIHMSLDDQFGEEPGYCVSDRLADHRPSPEDECIKSDLHGHLMHFVEELPPSLNKAFRLRDLDGMTISEAAQVLGVADVTVKAQVSRARARLKHLAGDALDSKSRLASTSVIDQRK